MECPECGGAWTEEEAMERDDELGALSAAVGDSCPFCGYFP